MAVNDTIEAAKALCDEGDWQWAAMTGRLTALEKIGVRWWMEGTREQIVIALCFLAAIHAR